MRRDIILLALAFLALLIVVGHLGETFGTSEARYVLLPFLVLASAVFGAVATAVVTKRAGDEMRALLEDRAPFGADDELDAQETLVARIEWSPESALARFAVALIGLLAGFLLAGTWLRPEREPTAPVEHPGDTKTPDHVDHTPPASQDSLHPAGCHTTAACFMLWLSCKGEYRCAAAEAPFGCERASCDPAD